MPSVHYADPPYVPETRVQGNRCYAHEMTTEDHEQFLIESNKLTGSVIISGYETELYNDMLVGWEKHQKESRISAGRGTAVRTETLWVKIASNQ